MAPPRGFARGRPILQGGLLDYTPPGPTQALGEICRRPTRLYRLESPSRKPGPFNVHAAVRGSGPLQKAGFDLSRIARVGHIPPFPLSTPPLCQGALHLQGEWGRVCVSEPTFWTTPPPPQKGYCDQDRHRPTERARQGVPGMGGPTYVTRFSVSSGA